MTQLQTNIRPRPEHVVRAFLTPRRPVAVVPLELEGIETIFIHTPEGEVAVQKAGTGPLVLLQHGWEGQASDLAAFGTSLVKAGFSVPAMHLPAHGNSKGKTASIPQSARAMLKVAEAIGPVHALIAHSVGAAVSVEAIHAGLALKKVVLIAAPARYEHFARFIAHGAGLNPEETEQMVALLSEAIGMDVGEVCMPKRAEGRSEAALFIHSADDRVVSIKDSLESAQAWHGALHMRMEGLGHARILSDPAVVKAAVDFVSAA